MNNEQTECSETSAYKIQILGNYPEESLQHWQPSIRLIQVVRSKYSDTYKPIQGYYFIWQIVLPFTQNVLVAGGGAAIAAIPICCVLGSHSFYCTVLQLRKLLELQFNPVVRTSIYTTPRLYVRHFVVPI